MWKLPVAMCVVGSLMAGCASKGFEWVKPGIARHTVAADDKACWHYALDTKEGREYAALVRTSAVLAGGVIGVVQGGMLEKDPRKDVGNRNAHAKCMTGKGYQNQPKA